MFVIYVTVCVISSNYSMYVPPCSLKVALGEEQVDSVLTGATSCRHEWQWWHCTIATCWGSWLTTVDLPQLQIWAGRHQLQPEHRGLRSHTLPLVVVSQKFQTRGHECENRKEVLFVCLCIKLMKLNHHHRHYHHPHSIHHCFQHHQYHPQFRLLPGTWRLCEWLGPKHNVIVSCPVVLWNSPYWGGVRRVLSVRASCTPRGWRTGQVWDWKRRSQVPATWWRFKSRARSSRLPLSGKVSERSQF